MRLGLVNGSSTLAFNPAVHGVSRNSCIAFACICCAGGDGISRLLRKLHGEILVEVWLGNPS